MQPALVRARARRALAGRPRRSTRRCAARAPASPTSAAATAGRRSRSPGPTPRRGRRLRHRRGLGRAATENARRGRRRAGTLPRRDAAGLPARPVDAAFAFECVHDMPHPVDVLAAVRRALVPGGNVVVMDEAVGRRVHPGRRRARAADVRVQPAHLPAGRDEPAAVGRHRHRHAPCDPAGVRRGGRIPPASTSCRSSDFGSGASTGSSHDRVERVPQGVRDTTVPVRRARSAAHTTRWVTRLAAASEGSRVGSPVETAARKASASASSPPP